jgi:hypothetical protein
VLRKGDPGEAGASSATGTETGDVAPPLRLAKIRELRDINVHHASCLDTKRDCTVGLGFKKQDSDSDKPVPHPLDAICDGTFLEEVLKPSVAEMLAFGYGFIEVVTDKPDGEITGLHYLPADQATVRVEDQQRNFHYLIEGPTDVGSGQRLFCRFGDKVRFLKKFPEASPETTSELIRLRGMSEMSRWYGYPSWLAAIPAIEIVQLLHQWKADFFLNRGVPEFMLFITGGSLSPKDWQAIQEKLKGHVGSGNSHKTMALNIPGKDIKVQVEKLGLDSSGDLEFQTTKDTLALDIVSGHRVPPLLAGIQIPGKLGASNEMTNALLSFHLLFCRSVQEQIRNTLTSTIGKRTKGLEGWFTFRSLKDEMFSALAEPGAVALSTVGGMRQGLPNAQAEGRDLGRGLRKSEDESLEALIQGAMRVHRSRR